MATFRPTASPAPSLLHSPDEQHKLDSLSKYTLFETRQRYYIVASTAGAHRVLKVDRTESDLTVLSVTEDPTRYDTPQLDLLLRMVQDGNKSQGGLDKVMEFHGIAGFIRFTAGWYMILITKRQVVGLVGGHYLYSCASTTLLSINAKAERSTQEMKQIAMFQQVDLSKNFYFAYNYDITNSLQLNLTRTPEERPWNTRFMWNHHLLSTAFNVEETRQGHPWVLPLIHGFIDQAKIHVLSRTVYVTIIARRSRHYAGARFLTRGANEAGHVANEVETEQIVCEPVTAGFSSTGQDDAALDYGGYTSFIQHRGSIPVMWHQETSQMTPRPPIEVTIRDPFFAPAAKHFNDLLRRYGAPIWVLNLIKTREPLPRESKLLPEFAECVAYLNQFLPDGKKMRYIPFDMSGAKKIGYDRSISGKGNYVVDWMENTSTQAIKEMGFFHAGAERGLVGKPERRTGMLLQHGVLRTNCIDCLDRTNSAQEIIARVALAHQLHALGLVREPVLPRSCDAAQLINELYTDHGDILAWQYTGSFLVNRVETFQRPKTAQWTSQSRDFIENLRRYYNNAVLDADKQAAINLFLGVKPVAPTLKRGPANYRNWFDPQAVQDPTNVRLVPFADVYNEYYKPHMLSHFTKLYAHTMNSTRSINKPRFDTSQSRLGPFDARREDSFEVANASPPSTPTSEKTRLDFVSPKSGKRNPGQEKAATRQEKPLPAEPEVIIEKHPVEKLIYAYMLDSPAMNDYRQRVQDYQGYLNYHTEDLLAVNDLPPDDLVIYQSAATLGSGDILDGGNREYERLVKQREKDAMKGLRSLPLNMDEIDQASHARRKIFEEWLKTPIPEGARPARSVA